MKLMTEEQAKRWTDECDKSRGRVLSGMHSHYCLEYNDVPVDETCPEWPCSCFEVSVPKEDGEDCDA